MTGLGANLMGGFVFAMSRLVSLLVSIFGLAGFLWLLALSWTAQGLAP
ncbi:MAG: hypothetical protein RL328_2319 [Acidobacteriota bacterium]|jgi:hypothetical protein